MGARLIRQWIEHPLTNAAEIISRQEAVAELVDNFMLREEIREKLTSVLDLERLVTKVSYGTAGARDLRAIAQTASILPDVKKMLSGITSGALKDIADGMDELGDIYELIDKSIEENPPFVVREGGMIKPGTMPTLTS